MATPPRQFAQAWVDAWNAKDLGAILSHYSDAVAFHSPRVAAAARARGAGGDASGRLVGKAQLGAYLQEALDKLGGVLSLTIQDVLEGVPGSFAVIYTRETGAKVVEVFHLDGDGKASAVHVFYDTVC